MSRERQREGGREGKREGKREGGKEGGKEGEMRRDGETRGETGRHIEGWWASVVGGGVGEVESFRECPSGGTKLGAMQTHE